VEFEKGEKWLCCNAEKKKREQGESVSDKSVQACPPKVTLRYLKVLAGARGHGIIFPIGFI
jgi:hypothetical protein